MLLLLFAFQTLNMHINTQNTKMVHIQIQISTSSERTIDRSLFNKKKKQNKEKNLVIVLFLIKAQVRKERRGMFGLSMTH